MIEIIIPINDSYRLNTDTYNFVIERRSRPRSKDDGEVEGEGNWKPAGYYGSIQAALNDLVDMAVRDLDKLEEIEDAMESLKLDIQNMTFPEHADVHQTRRREK